MTESEVKFFDSLAPDWDAGEIRSTPERVKHILAQLPISSGMEILDLGTGTGVLIPYLSEIVGSSGKVVGIDLSEGMLSQAIWKFDKLENVNFLKLDFEKEEIPGVYDVALLYSVYPHLHFPADTIYRLFKMNIKKGGCLVIAFPSDEKFINNIHHERKSESDYLPPAPILASLISEWGYSTQVISATEEEYIVVVRKSAF